MHKEPTRFSIHDRVYTIGSWSVDKQLETLVWLTKTFGEGILSLFMTEGSFDGVETLLDGKKPEDVVSAENKAKIEKEKKAITELVEKLTKNLDSKEYVKYAKHIVEGVHCGGGKVNFSTHFIGRIGELHQVIFHTLRHQYGDFLGGNAEGEQ